ncbi:hypothetical protein GGI42DRAFT_283400 [Trichoderma sp. SZMC 28013]
MCDPAFVDGGNRGDSQLAAGRRVSSHLLARCCVYPPLLLFQRRGSFTSLSFLGLPAAKSETFALFLFFSTARHFALFSTLPFFFFTLHFEGIIISFRALPPFHSLTLSSPAALDSASAFPASYCL